MIYEKFDFVCHTKKDGNNVTFRKTLDIGSIVDSVISADHALNILAAMDREFLECDRALVRLTDAIGLFWGLRFNSEVQMKYSGEELVAKFVASIHNLDYSVANLYRFSPIFERDLSGLRRLLKVTFPEVFNGCPNIMCSHVMSKDISCLFDALTEATRIDYVRRADLVKFGDYVAETRSNISKTQAKYLKSTRRYARRGTAKKTF